MNETEHLLTILGEECNESGQRASKAIRFGLSEIEPGQDEDNRRRLERELAEIVGVAEMLGLRIRDEDKTAKIEKVKRFMEYSRKIGTLDPLPPECTCSIDGTPFCKARGTGYCLAENGRKNILGGE